MNAIYAIYFTGAASSGFAVVVFKDGVITGADAAGGLIDGTYKSIDDGKMLEGTVTVTIPPGAPLVTGAVAGSEPMVFDIPLKVPANLGGGQPLGIQSPTGPINTIFKKLRDLG